MRRDRQSAKAVDAAIKIAQIRGEVKLFRQTPGNPFDIFISGPGGGAAICARRARCLHMSLAEIAIEYGEPLARIIAAAQTPGISHEFWLWSPYGSLRFFRIAGLVLIELDRLGMMRNPVVSFTMQGRSGGAKGSVDAVPGKNITQEKLPDTPVTPQSSGSSPAPPPGPATEREPHYIRYLRRRNRERSQSKDPPANPGKGSPDGEVPGGDPPSVGGDISPS